MKAASVRDRVAHKTRWDEKQCCTFYWSSKQQKSEHHWPQISSGSEWPRHKLARSNFLGCRSLAPSNFKSRQAFGEKKGTKRWGKEGIPPAFWIRQCQASSPDTLSSPLFEWYLRALASTDDVNYWTSVSSGHNRDHQHWSVQLCWKCSTMAESISVWAWVTAPKCQATRRFVPKSGEKCSEHDVP